MGKPMAEPETGELWPERWAASRASRAERDSERKALAARPRRESVASWVDPEKEAGKPPPVSV